MTTGEDMWKPPTNSFVLGGRLCLHDRWTSNAWDLDRACAASYGMLQELSSEKLEEDRNSRAGIGLSSPFNKEPQEPDMTDM